mmetsp:Transcript_659/g.1104  ORF Transcript_659/g.1104 Transcript_659/m.1104 type:complete len:330 (-) Transcript_659:252-1241(-)
MAAYTIDYTFNNRVLSVKPVDSLYQILRASVNGDSVPKEVLRVLTEQALSSCVGAYCSPMKGKRCPSPELPASPITVSCLSDDVCPSEPLYDMRVISRLREIIFSSNSIMKALPAPKEHQPILISIEGNIGAGKSTLLQSLREDHPEWTFIDEPVDFWTALKNDDGESLFELYYHNQDRWAYTFQNCAVLSRYQLIEQTVNKNRASIPGKHVYITERCLETDYQVFAKKLHADGKLDSLEFDLYEKWIQQLQKTSTALAGVILVDAPASVCADRIKGRNRDGEEGIPLGYLEELETYQSRWIDTLQVPCTRTTTVQDIEAFVADLLQQH